MTLELKREVSCQTVCFGIDRTPTVMRFRTSARIHERPARYDKMKL
jgi:hypothetical protein